MSHVRPTLIDLSWKCPASAGLGEERFGNVANLRTVRWRRHAFPRTGCALQRDPDYSLQELRASSARSPRRTARVIGSSSPSACQAKPAATPSFPSASCSPPSASIRMESCRRRSRCGARGWRPRGECFERGGAERAGVVSPPWTSQHIRTHNTSETLRRARCTPVQTRERPGALRSGPLPAARTAYRWPYRCAILSSCLSARNHG
jgi:hypothetical protein